MSTTALSNAIRKLEASLGVRLFNRTTRSVSLTDAGRVFAEQVRPALQDIRSAGANVAVGYARGQEGAERVAAEIGAAGGRAITVQGDLAKTADIEAMVAKAVATFGPIDTLVNGGARREWCQVPRDSESFAAAPVEARDTLRA